MIKKEITELAKNIGIQVFGFSENSFVALFPYYKKGEEGNISLYARSLDYHKVIKEKLSPICDKFKAFGDENAFIHCDNGGLDDRKAAFNAGLGFFGKNNMLINDIFGSYFFIGQVVHHLNIEPDCALDKTCLNCNRCIEFCCTGVLKDGFEKSKCLSEITQKKGELNDEEKTFIKKGGLCWGCDMCQMVCPHNQNLEDTATPEFLEKRITKLELSDFENLSERGFKKKYGTYAFAWRGGAVIRRNLEILKES